MMDSLFKDVRYGLRSLLKRRGVEAIAKVVPENLSKLQSVSIDARVFLFTLGVSALTAVVFGGVPALLAARTKPGETLSEVGREASGLLIRSFQLLRQVDIGFTTENVLTMKMVLRQGMLLTMAGLVVGIAVGSVATRVLSDMLYGVTARDPLTFIGVPALLLLVAFLACYIPARRATRIDPLVALRYE
jgi:ABC-type lipoprotein release transport system permease subunit